MRRLDHHPPKVTSLECEEAWALLSSCLRRAEGYLSRSGPRSIMGCMLKWLKGLFAGPPGFDTLPALERCRPIRVRPYTDADFDVCLGIYKQNEPGRFPEKYIDRFSKVLRDLLSGSVYARALAPLSHHSEKSRDHT